MSKSSFPTAALSIVRVADFDAWLPKFDATAQLRKDNGILGHHHDRGADDPNLVCTFFIVGDRQRATSFLLAPELVTRLASQGITVVQNEMVAVVEDRTARGGQYASVLLTHEVENFERWMAGFDGHAEARRRASIVGHGVCRSIDRPLRVHVYLQAESPDKLRALLAGDDTRDAMRKAGVTGTPEVKLMTDTGIWAQY
jgi:hypothetical protein